MGHQTVKNVKRCFTYADAKYLHDSTKPIRGREPEIRPLGARRDAGTYSVRMNGEDVVFVLYRTPVITYKPNGDVVVKTEGWSSVSTHQFIQQVLGISCSGVQRNTVLKLNGGRDKHIIPKNKSITMIHAGGNWRITESHAIYEHRLNRKAANEVRKKYADFLNYAKGVAKLRSEMVEPSRWARRQNPYAVVTLNEQETAMPRFGTEELVRELMGYLSLYQPEETKHENYNMAFAMALNGCSIGKSGDGYIVVTEEVLSLIDELLLRAHAQDVLVWTELKVGQVPSGRYRGWLPDRG